MKKLFVFEIDNVVCQTDATLERLLGYDFRDELPAETIQAQLSDPNIYYTMDANEDVIGLILDLHASGYPVGFYCNRPFGARPFTKRWLKKNLDGMKPAFTFCEVDDKANFLYDIDGAFEFVVERDRKHVEPLMAEGYSVLTLANDEHETMPQLLFYQDGTAMIWLKQSEEAIPLFQYLAEKEEGKTK